MKPGRTWRRLAFAALAAPALVQLALLFTAMLSRVFYPFDLEWMEGGLLHHALRIATGQGIYVPPSIDFIPYLYTPLYPGLLALLSSFGELGYALGRGVSIAATAGTLGVMAAAVANELEVRDRTWGWLGGSAAGGFFAATYPWVEGWYDIVRADSLFLLMILCGLYGLRTWAKAPGQAGLAKVAAAAALLALSFFCKQTGVLYVAGGGVLLAVVNWRRIPVYVGVTGSLGLGGTWLLNHASDGWFWTYVFEVHQAHDFSRERFIASFGHMLGRFPAMTAVSLGALTAVAFARKKTGALPTSSRPLLLWTPLWALSLVVGALGWATEFAHFNAFIPAMASGAIAAGTALPALASSLRDLWPAAERRALLLPGLAAAVLAANLLAALWSPARFIPSGADARRGDALVAHIRSVPGEVFIPYHPWYAHLAGKRLHTHFMGIRDVSTGRRWPVAGLREALTSRAFSEVILDNRPLGGALPGLSANYRVDDLLPSDLRPRVYTGAGAISGGGPALTPDSLWIPSTPAALPPGARALFDFESGELRGWRQRGGRGVGPKARRRPPSEAGTGPPLRGPLLHDELPRRRPERRNPSSPRPFL